MKMRVDFRHFHKKKYKKAFPVLLLKDVPDIKVITG